MASAAQLLQQVDAAIESLLQAMIDGATQEYQFNGRAWKRADFPGAIRELRRMREELQQEVDNASRRRIHVGALRRR